MWSEARRHEGTKARRGSAKLRFARANLEVCTPRARANLEVCTARRAVTRFSAGPLFLVTLSLCHLVTLAGCQATLPESKYRQDPVPRGNADLIDFISEQPLVTGEPVYRAVYILSQGEPHAGSFEEVKAALIEKEMAREEWNHGPNTLMNRAGVAYMIGKAVGLKTGLNWFLFDQGRYAWRELQRLGIGGPGSELGHLTGGEFNGILARANRYIAEKQRRTGDTPPPEQAELGSEPPGEPAGDPSDGG